MKKDNSRIIGLDVLKCLCIAFVVFLHTGMLKESFQTNLEPIGRFAVPCFFMITGFFYNTTVRNGKELKQIKKIFVLIIIVNLVLLALNIIYIGDGAIDWIISCFSKSKIFSLVVFNEGIITGHYGSNHVWYLNALLYVLIIAFVLRKLKLIRVLYYLTPILLITGFILECFSKPLFGVSFSDSDRYYIYRNFLTVGIPYFCIGNLLNEFDLITKLKPKRLLLIICTLITIALSYLEFRVELYFNLSTNGEFFIVTPLCAVCVFSLFCCLFEGENTNGFSRVLALIGRKYIVWIYLFHLPIIVIIGDMLPNLGIVSSNRIIISVLTLALSLIVAALVEYMISVFKQKRGMNEK